VTDAEVYQEILHRYVAIGRRDAIQPAFDVLNELVDEIFPVDWTAVDRAKSLVLAYARQTARDAIHVAVMEQHAVTDILTFDAGFDEIPGIARVSI
jgi:predicted nucleic acid-binding protein